MMKRIWTLGSAAAALAVSAALVSSSATAQNYGNNQLAGGPKPQVQADQQFTPEQFRVEQGDQPFQGEGYRSDGRRNDGWNNDRDRDRGRIDFQTAQRSCSRAGIQEAWNRNYYSAQYDGGPRFFEGRRGWELRGRMRLHDRSGYRYVDTTCEVRRSGEAVRFEFLR